MRSLSKTVQNLEARRTALTGELARIEARLAIISKALAGEATPGPAAGGVRRGKGNRPTASKRAWFEKNEIGKLLRRAAKSPSAVADVVRGLAKLKGYDKSLSPEEMKRFQGAAFMAVSHGVKSKVLKRRADGSVVAA